MKRTLPTPPGARLWIQLPQTVQTQQVLPRSTQNSRLSLSSPHDDRRGSNEGTSRPSLIFKKIIEDKDLQITQLTSNQDHTNVEEPHDSHKHASFSYHVENEKQVDKVPLMHDSMQKSTYSEASITTLSVQQLHEMNTNTIKTHHGEMTQSSPAYSKPYTKRIDALRMPTRYQPPELR
ncbi:UNVERIFIED_CONTAM: hypothetical protein Slati_2958800 [Sesamum latifolium]|uniref:Uncharacterized protein n=1 Tax=Sesamum latifolium TaxID=2727402 RepID=A0AAW2VE56_9LAMI